MAKIDLNPGKFSLFIDGYAGDGSSGDIAIDDFSIFNRSCSATDETTWRTGAEAVWDLVGNLTNGNYPDHVGHYPSPLHSSMSMKRWLCHGGNDTKGRGMGDTNTNRGRSGMQECEMGDMGDMGSMMGMPDLNMMSQYLMMTYMMNPYMMNSHMMWDPYAMTMHQQLTHLHMKLNHMQEEMKKGMVKEYDSKEEMGDQEMETDRGMRQQLCTNQNAIGEECPVPTL